VVYHFDGTEVTAISKQNLLDLEEAQDVKEAKSISIYYDGDFFWAIDYDASLQPVDNGCKPNQARSDHRSSSDSEGGLRMDWSPVRFNPVELPSGHIEGMSSVHIVGSDERLYGTREDQIWPRFLLPNRMRPGHRHRNRTDVGEPFGSLTGDVCLLLALLAFASPVEHVHHTFTTCIRGDGWQAPTLHTPGIGRTDKRGMVITLYVPWPNEGEDEVDLNQYEKLPFFA